MTRFRRWLRRAAPLAVCLPVLVAATAMAPGEEPAVEVKDVPEQVILYTIYRGPYENVGSAIGPLFMKAFQDGMPPQGPITLVYLNNPALVEPAHCLTEVRIPVGEAALQKAGTLGDFTDVKKLAAMRVAVIKKGKGVTDQAGLRNALNSWLRRNGYTAIDACGECMQAQMGATDYAQMETEIIYPVTRIAEQ